MKEAAARIKINKLLEAAGWRFFADSIGPANRQLEPSVKLNSQALYALSANFEEAGKGFIDFLLLTEKGFPFIIVEAKAADKDPLVGKEQALMTLGEPRPLFVFSITKDKLHRVEPSFTNRAMGSRSCTFDLLLQASQ